MLAYDVFFFEVYGDHRDLHVLTHSFPTRRSSDLLRRNPLPEFARRHAGGTAERVAETRWRRKAERIRHRLDALVAQQHVLGVIDPRVRNVADRKSTRLNSSH